MKGQTILKQKALERSERHAQIQRLFSEDLDTGGQGLLTANEIAKQLGISASTKLRNMLADLVHDHKLVAFTEDIPGVCKFRRVYALSPDNLYRISPKRPRQGRGIAWKSRNHSEYLEIVE